MKNISILFFVTSFIAFNSYAADEEIVWINTGLTQEFIESKKEQARRDAKKDILENKLGGFYLSQFGEENEDIKISVLKKYNIVGKGISCIPLPGQKEYSEIYDSIIEEEILHRYGKDFWPKVENEIEKETARVLSERKSNSQKQ